MPGAAWQITDPKGEVGTTSSSDILRARYFETDTELVFEIEVDDIDAPERISTAIFSAFIFYIGHADGSDDRGFNLYLTHLPPHLTGSVSWRVHGSIIENDLNENEHAPINGTADLVSNRLTGHVPKALLSRFDPHVGAGSVVQWTHAEVRLGPCHPAGVSSMSCSFTSAVNVASDWAPQDGLMGQLSQGEPLVLWWHNETAPNPPSHEPPATEPVASFPVPSVSSGDSAMASGDGSDTPLASTWGLLVALIVSAGMVSRRRRSLK